MSHEDIQVAPQRVTELTIVSEQDARPRNGEGLISGSPAGWATGIVLPQQLLNNRNRPRHLFYPEVNTKGVGKLTLS